jgi:hypothetical protein
VTVAARRKARLVLAEKCIQELQAQPTFEAISAWLEANYKILFARQLLVGNIGSFRGKEMPRDFQIKNVRLVNMQWDDLCSNSHSAPKGKQQNWCGRSDAKGVPRGYPGFRGRIQFEIGKHYTYSTDLLRGTGIHTGSGGGGNSSEYEVTLFAEEWPALVMNDRYLFHTTRMGLGLRLYEGTIPRGTPLLLPS